MKAAVVRIGNSRGVRIPKALLEQCRFRDTVELEVEDGHDDMPTDVDDLGVASVHGRAHLDDKIVLDQDVAARELPEPVVQRQDVATA
jgi:antitoxin component of MazEF toxin-antitoxin module